MLSSSAPACGSNADSDGISSTSSRSTASACAHSSAWISQPGAAACSAAACPAHSAASGAKTEAAASCTARSAASAADTPVLPERRGTAICLPSSARSVCFMARSAWRFAAGGVDRGAAGTAAMAPPPCSGGGSGSGCGCHCAARTITANSVGHSCGKSKRAMLATRSARCVPMRASSSPAGPNSSASSFARTAAFSSGETRCQSGAAIVLAKPEPTVFFASTAAMRRADSGAPFCSTMASSDSRNPGAAPRSHSRSAFSAGLRCALSLDEARPRSANTAFGSAGLPAMGFNTPSYATPQAFLLLFCVLLKAGRKSQLAICVWSAMHVGDAAGRKSHEVTSHES